MIRPYEMPGLVRAAVSGIRQTTVPQKDWIRLDQGIATTQCSGASAEQPLPSLGGHPFHDSEIRLRRGQESGPLTVQRS